MSTLIIEDLVSRKWVAHLTSSEETYSQVQAAFEMGLKSEGLWEQALTLAKEQGQALGTWKEKRKPPPSS